MTTVTRCDGCEKITLGPRMRLTIGEENYGFDREQLLDVCSDACAHTALEKALHELTKWRHP